MQGFNKYYPPDYVPEQGSLNSVHGKHALGDRARKLDKGILIVRFELPFNIWCGHCEGHIGQGVRYNAEKSKVGNYYTTPIWNFRCKCHLCQKWFEIRTDPQNTRYVVHSGARQQNQDWDPVENGGVVLDENIANPSGIPDPFAALEKSQTQRKTALTVADQLNALEEDRDAYWSDPFATSSRLRASFRQAKKARIARDARAEDIRDRYGLGERIAKDRLNTPARQEDREREEREWSIAKRKQETLARDERSNLMSQQRIVGVRTSRAKLEQPSSTSTLRSRLLLAKAVKDDPFSSSSFPSNPLSLGAKRSRAPLEGLVKVVPRSSK
ncbi:BQ2448_1563 [Microbotryum intermedium]|uniref:BQ2448_1563 protein n=1 Tax=Microbotryum intermedium TaxID=269621 RepID=A0A238FBK8_9BASI|nr:BQ2448_1563 [Microbotryum intermedium]